MPTYAIGDIQGCFTELKKLLAHIHFDIETDTLWFTGDLVNRGPQSLEVLRFIKNLPRYHVVLGNHDLHLLAVAYGVRSPSPGDTLTSILEAPDRDELLGWLCQQPLLHHDQKLNFVLVHAGLAANWDLVTAKKLAREVESVLQNKNKIELLKHMYGNQPDYWDDKLTGYDRLRCIINYFTRLRYCYPDGRLELSSKGTIADTSHLVPWFNVSGRKNAKENIIFGHWAALGGITDTPHTFALDTGCVWGNALTALRLEDQKRFSVPCALKS